MTNIFSVRHHWSHCRINKEKIFTPTHCVLMVKNQKVLDSGGETCKATDGSLPKRRQKHQSSVEGDREMEEAFLEREGERALLCVMASLPERTAASPTIPTSP